MFAVRDPRGGIIVVEGFLRPGGTAFSNPPLLEPVLPPSPTPPSERPDLWIEANRNLGNGSTKICDYGAPAPDGGGIPGVPTPTFDPASQFVTNTLLDFACRFVVLQPSTACTRDAFGNPSVVNPSVNPQWQFCDLVNEIEAFPVGDTVLTTRLRDSAGQLGPTAQIIVRVVPSPTPPP